jgi:hypothetical protein
VDTCWKEWLEIPRKNVWKPKGKNVRDYRRLRFPSPRPHSVEQLDKVDNLEQYLDACLEDTEENHEML